MNKRDPYTKNAPLDECDMEGNQQNELDKLDELKVNLLLHSFLKAQDAADKLLENNVAEGNKLAMAFKRTARKIVKAFQ